MVSNSGLTRPSFLWLSAAAVAAPAVLAGCADGGDAGGGGGGRVPPTLIWSTSTPVAGAQGGSDVHLR
jgi:hypothetical protein